jgi:hypothetical protein
VTSFGSDSDDGRNANGANGANDATDRDATEPEGAGAETVMDGYRLRGMKRALGATSAGGSSDSDNADSSAAVRRRVGQDAECSRGGDKIPASGMAAGTAKMARGVEQWTLKAECPDTRR